MYRQQKLLIVLLAMLNALNILDWIYTLYFVKIGATELNPILSPVMQHSMGAAGALKIGWVLLVSIVLAVMAFVKPDKYLKTILKGFATMNVVFFLVIIYHNYLFFMVA